MNSFIALNSSSGRAICYSGFREGQQPGGIFPSYEEVKEDLILLQPHWKYLRLCDCDENAGRVLQVVEQEKLPFQIMLGAYIVAEMNNFGCPRGGGVYTEAQLNTNRIKNRSQIEKLVLFANKYPTIICTLSAGKEACADWTDHYVSVASVIEYVNAIKKATKQPVTFCENYVPWLSKLTPLPDVVDFIFIRTYPVWEYKNIHEALNYTKDNFFAVANRYPDKPIVITKAGWATNTNGRGIEPHNVSEENQEIYHNNLVECTDREEILIFIFEAFDQSWKGSSEPPEPEKHRGLFKKDRTPRLVMEGKQE